MERLRNKFPTGSVFFTSQEDSTKHDFVQTCEKYLKALDIRFSFDQIGKMSKPAFKKLLKEKARLAAFTYLIVDKSKESKLFDIKYEKL